MAMVERAESPGAVPASSRMPLSALEILYGLGSAHPAGSRGRAWSLGVWVVAGAVGALACWRIVADHFALSRSLDAYASLALNRMASQNGVLNHAIHIASEATLLTGGLLVGLVWFCWFSDDARAARQRLLLGFGAVLVTAALSRLLQVSLPMRLRPFHDAASGFLPLPGIDTAMANHWGSFPSDHAALFFALVTVIWQRSRWLGAVGFLSALYGTLPRVYFGLHYLSDIAAGAVLGWALVLLFERFGPRRLAERGVLLEQRRPGLFYALAFLASFEAATLFEDIRQIGRGIPSVLKQFGIG